MRLVERLGIQCRWEREVDQHFKIIHNLINIDPSKYFQFTPADSKTRGHEYKLRKQVYGSSQLFKFFFKSGSWLLELPPKRTSQLRFYCCF